MDERLAVLVDELAANRRQQALPVRIGVAIGRHVTVAELHAHQLGANVPRQLVRLAADHIVAEVGAAPATSPGREHDGLGADDRHALLLAAQGDGAYYLSVLDQQVRHDRLVQRLGLAPPDSHLPHELHQLGAIESYPCDRMPPVDLASAADELPVRVHRDRTAPGNDLPQALVVVADDELGPLGIEQIVGILGLFGDEGVQVVVRGQAEDHRSGKHAAPAGAGKSLLHDQDALTLLACPDRGPQAGQPAADDEHVGREALRGPRAGFPLAREWRWGRC